MKKVEEYLSKVNSLTLREDLYDIGRQIQKDAIEYTLQVAAENIDLFCRKHFTLYSIDKFIHKVNKRLRIKIKNQLFKVLENLI